MKQYIGTKIVQAEPMNRLEFNAYRGVSIPKDDAHASDEGYKVVYPDNYVSWSPKDVFEDAYRLTNGMDFGLAIEAMKIGYTVAREGFFVGEYLAIKIPDKVFNTDISEPFIYKRSLSEERSTNKKGEEIKVPWTPTQQDMLRNDWYIIK